MKLLGDNILCKLVVKEKEEKGGLILPSNFNDQPIYEVVLIGPKVKHLKPGDMVVKYRNSNCYNVYYDNCIHSILSESSDIELIEKCNS